MINRLLTRLIRGITDNDLWLKCAHLFRRSEKLGFQEELAELFISQLFVNLDTSNSTDTTDDEIERKDEDFKEAINWILKYLKIENEYADADFAELQKEREMNKEKEKKWIRYFFHEFIIYSFISRLVTFYKLDTFSFLLEWNWFNPQNYGFKRQVALEMEREVTIALGWNYRSHSHHDSNDPGEKGQNTKEEQMKKLIGKLFKTFFLLGTLIGPYSFIRQGIFIGLSPSFSKFLPAFNPSTISLFMSPNFYWNDCFFRNDKL